jgi:diguanylate cyclase (GGDEF)-like protein
MKLPYTVRLLLICAAFFGMAATARAGPVLDLARSGDFQELSPFVDLATDPTNTKSLSQMRGADYAAVDHLELPDSGVTYWLRLRIANPSKEPWLLTTGFRPFQADLFVPTASGYAELRNGDAIPYAQRPYKAFNWIAFALPGTAAPETFYLRIRTIEPLVNVVGYSEQRFHQDNIRDIVVIAALLSVLVSLIISSVVLYFVMRDPIYLYYAAYIVAQLVYRANDFGLIAVYVFPNSPFPYVRTEVIFDGITLVLATIFIRRFLRSHTHSVLLDRLNVAIAVIGATYTVLALLGVPIRYTLVQDFSFAYVPIWLITGVVCWRKGYAPARLFIFAWAAYMVGIVLEAAVDLGLTAQLGIVRESSPDVVLDYIVYLGIALESILLSLSLAQAYRAATSEKERIAQSSIRHLRELIEMRERTERMADLAYSDALTHLPNRAAFIERVDEALHAATRHKRSCALLYIDLDDFKSINDTLGHPAGDAALVETASRLRKIVRGEEVVGRLGGDEFAVFLPDVKDRFEVDRVIERIRTAFSAPMIVAGKLKVVGASIGSASFPGEAGTRDGLMELADAAMYRSKGKGKGSPMGAEGPQPIME